MLGPLRDGFGRVHSDLRVSVTDRCNLRCWYCMPPTGIQFRPRAEILSLEEIGRVVQVGARLGIRRIRLTGGEPLVRKGIDRLVEILAAIAGIEEVAMTTNGVLLAGHAAAVKAAGLTRLNVSLDTLDPQKFRQLANRDELTGTLKGIDAALQVGFRSIKVNAMAIRGFSETEIVPLARFARDRGLDLRFIEFMPVDPARGWNPRLVLPAAQILAVLAQAFGPLEQVPPQDPRAPATQYRLADGTRIGVIPSVSRPFCGDCDRLRLTADGRLRNCLFSCVDWDLRGILREGGSDEHLAESFRAAVSAKCWARGTDDGRFGRSDLAMHQIGG